MLKSLAAAVQKFIVDRGAELVCLINSIWISPR